MLRSFMRFLFICVIATSALANSDETSVNSRDSEEIRAEIDSINTILHGYDNDSEETPRKEASPAKVRTESSRSDNRRRRRERRRERIAEERADPTPYQVKRPNKITLHSRFSAVGPYDDSDGNIIRSFGVGYTRNINEKFGVGIKDLNFSSSNTTSGEVREISVAPKVEYSYSPAKWCQLGSEFGVITQFQFGDDIDSERAIVPFLGLMNQYFVRPRFSIGPELQFNYVANGDYLIESSGSSSSTIPQNGVWIDGGFSLAFHF